MDMHQRLDLADIPGLGPVRRDALAEAGVVDLSGLLAMKVSELAAVRGIGLWQARKIREYLRQKGLLVEDSRTDPASEENTPIVIHEPESFEQAQAVAEVMVAMEAQAEAEARVEAEVQLLSQALETAREENGGSVRKTSVQNTKVDASAEGMEREAASPASKNGTDPAKEEPVLEIAADVEDAAPEEEEPSPAPEEEADGETETAQSGEPEGDLQPEELAEVEATGELTGATTRELLQDIQARRERLPEMALALIEAIRQAAVCKQLTRQVTRLLITSGEFATIARPEGATQLRAAAEALAQAEELLQRALEKEAFSEKAQKELADRIRKRRKSLDRLLEEPEVEDR